MSLKQRLSQPGYILSACVHAGALVATLIAFSQTDKFETEQETVPVEIVTDNQFNQIMKGDKSAKEVRPDAPSATEQTASLPAAAPEPPPPVQSEPPPPPPPSPPKQAVQPPPPPVTPPPRPATPLPPPPPVPVPTPPVRPVVAEPDLPAPLPTPKPPPPVPLPPVVPHPQVVRHDPPKPVPTPPKPHPPEKPKVDQLAKLMAEQPETPPAPVQKPTPPRPAKPVQPTPEANKFDLTDITKLLFSNTHDRQEAKPASSQPARVASLGSPTASAPKMSPSFWAGLDGLLEDQYRGCWSYLGLAGGTKYIPQVRVIYGQDGSLQGQPVLLNPPSDPDLQSLADSALRAVRRCNPLKIPEQYAPYYEQWRGRVLRFDPAEMAG